jgi:ParB family transcriptional regulator, chromosome partitioning protein
MMAEEAARPRLGRGLAALMGDVGDEHKVVERARGQRRVPMEFLRPNTRNPRRHFDPAELDELASSIRERGVIQPIVVRPVVGASDTYEIIAGERRWRAAQRAGQHEVPIIVMDASDREALEIAIVENVQRTDLNPLEEAMGYQALAQEFGHSQEEIGKVVGKSRSHVANMLRLLLLPEQVRKYLAEGKLTAGHARTLVGVSDPERLANLIVEQQLNVREAEAIAQENAAKSRRPSKRGTRVPKDADTRALERRLSDQLGLEVSIRHAGAGGELSIRYKSLEQLDEVIRRLERAG